MSERHTRGRRDHKIGVEPPSQLSAPRDVVVVEVRLQYVRRLHVSLGEHGEESTHVALRVDDQRVAVVDQYVAGVTEAGCPYRDDLHAGHSAPPDRGSGRTITLLGLPRPGPHRW